jgi:site-specific recombinase XerD
MKCTLKRAVTALERMRPSVPLWKLTLEDYMAWVNQQREAGYSPQSLNKDLSHLRGLLEYAWRSGRADRNVLDGFSLQDSLRVVVPKFLSLEEARRLVEACPSHTRLERRNRLVILLLYGCGLRTSELCQLDVKDADLARQEIVIHHGKGDRARRIPVPDAVWTVLLAYLAERKGRRGALIRTDNGPEFISDQLHRLLTRLGLIACHTPCRSPQSNGLVESFSAASNAIIFHISPWKLWPRP